MFSRISSHIALALAVFAGLVASQCPTDQPIALCCLSLNPFSDNEYVWEDVCGITVPDTSLLVAAACGGGLWSVDCFLET